MLLDVALEIVGEVGYFVLDCAGIIISFII